MPRDEDIDGDGVADDAALVARSRAALLRAPPYPAELSFASSVGGLAFSPDSPSGARLLRAAAERAARGSDEAAFDVLASLAAVEPLREAVAGALEAAAAAADGALTLAPAAAPGARAAALALMLRLSPGYGLSARDLLELSPGRRLDGAVDCLVALLAAPRAPRHLASDGAELALACARLVWGLTLPETLYAGAGAGADDEEGGAAEDTNAVPLAELTRRYTSNVNELISLVLDRPVFQRASAVVRPWLVRHTKMRAVMTREEGAAGAAIGGAVLAAVGGAAAAAAAAAEAEAEGDDSFANAAELDGSMHAFCGYLLRAVHNLLLFSTEAQAKLREHVSAAGGVVEQVVLPYTGMVTAAIGAVEEFRARLDAEGGPAAAASAAELLPLHQQLLSSLHSALEIGRAHV